ncbi:Cytochrome P450 [Popillia japonica]|uniref:Cytochrome P450 n=1 Tax=Popillia japonica TaxID=7064 RepID=A0AAW1MEH7_POPJA
MYLVALGFIFGTWYLISYIQWLRNIYNPMSRLPGPIRLPIFGTKYRFIGVPREKILEIGKQNIVKYAPIFCTWTGSTAELQLIRAEYVEVIMNSTLHISKGKQYDRLKPWLGQGLLTSSGRRWFQHRKLITPTFHFKILENFMDVFIEKSQNTYES